MSVEYLAGGCQCGAVRYRIKAPLIDPHLCHCRMCQKAAGNYLMPLASAFKSDFEVTRGEVSWFRSSEPVRRGFCSRCGTPLVFERPESPRTAVTLGSLDDPSAIKPVSVYGEEGRMPWLAEVCAKSGPTTGSESEEYRPMVERIAATNRQHPDHDTETWPPETSR